MSDWQYAISQSFSGVSGTVDLSFVLASKVIAVDVSSLQKKASWNKAGDIIQLVTLELVNGFFSTLEVSNSFNYLGFEPTLFNFDAVLGDNYRLRFKPVPWLTDFSIVIWQFRPPNYSILINCGGGDYTDALGKLWRGNIYQIAGQIFTRSDAYNFVGDSPELFTTEAYSFAYDIPVQAGSFKVRLYFVEFDSPLQRPRVFSVSINGAAVLTNFSIYNEIGLFAVLVKEFTVQAPNGQILIESFNIQNNSKVCAIEIIPL